MLPSVCGGAPLFIEQRQATMTLQKDTEIDACEVASISGCGIPECRTTGLACYPGCLLLVSFPDRRCLVRFRRTMTRTVATLHNEERIFVCPISARLVGRCLSTALDARRQRTHRESCL